ncbi:hypothetical protein [Clostridium sp. BJN0013]|uniref:hypothetical protein n=1 Tax=Clostridium sp. BJN0013 TaxID=3236840 RepID=UPI0034C5F84E
MIYTGEKLLDKKLWLIPELLFLYLDTGPTCDFEKPIYEWKKEKLQCKIKVDLPTTTKIY